jgi:hypothetical protein
MKKYYISCKKGQQEQVKEEQKEEQPADNKLTILSILAGNLRKT